MSSSVLIEPSFFDGVFVLRVTDVVDLLCVDFFEYVLREEVRLHRIPNVLAWH